MYKEKIINIQTGEEILRDYNKNEIAQVEAGQKEAELRIKMAGERKANRESALAKLAAFGLTEEEIAAL